MGKPISDILLGLSIMMQAMIKKNDLHNILQNLQEYNGSECNNEMNLVLFKDFID